MSPPSFTIRRTTPANLFLPKTNAPSAKAMPDSQSYMLSEDGEFVKVVGDHFEYTGMYFMN